MCIYPDTFTEIAILRYNCLGALLGEYKRNSSIDSSIEYLRQWGKAIVQKIVANGQGYALVGFETKAEEAGLIEQMVIAGFENIQCEFWFILLLKNWFFLSVLNRNSKKEIL